MPYADSEKQRQYIWERMSRIRAEWFQENGPCKNCGSDVDLELDHIDPSTKVEHRIWSWSKKRRDEELAKCQVLCHECHKNKTLEQTWRKPIPPHGAKRYSHADYPCRCQICKDGAAEQKRQWRARTGKH